MLGYLINKNIKQTVYNFFGFSKFFKVSIILINIGLKDILKIVNLFLFTINFIRFIIIHFKGFIF